MRPWGSFKVLHEGPGFKVKEIAVRPGCKLSLQSHKYRAEHWTVVEGTARVTVDDEIKDLGPNSYIHVPLGARHRLENPGTAPMRLIEPLFFLFADAPHADLARQVQFLRAENRILRSQIPGRVHLTQSDRRKLVRLADPWERGCGS